MFTLYQYGNSVCAQKVRVTLCEKGLTWETRNVDLFRAEQFSPEYLKINPKGLVPTLVHDGATIIESTLICEYLEDAFPNPPLVPADPLERARMRLWSKAVDEGLHEGVTEISFSAMFREAMKGMTEAQRQARFRNVGDPKRRDRFMSTYQLGIDSPYVTWAVAAFEKAFASLEQALSAGGHWILASGYSLADINLMPYVARLDYLNLLDIWIGERPATRAWWERARARASFRAAISEPMTAEEVQRMRHSGGRVRDRVAAIRADCAKALREAKPA
jgi:glutathione S-transferase